MVRFTAKQLEILRCVAADGIRGEWRHNDGWVFSGPDKAHTATVLALSAKALITISYSETTARVSLAPRGRELLAQQQGAA